MHRRGRIFPSTQCTGKFFFLASILLSETFCICRFDKIIKREIPSTVVYEDEKVLYGISFLYTQLG
jgi:hypothetical protein